MKQQENKNGRIEVMTIDGMIYKVFAEEISCAKETPYDVIRRLVQNNKERICCLEPDGGRKVC